jgi:HPt (histidine-containing phosphotransfer) domain-containing protein
MIDWDRLHNLRTDIGEDDFCDVACVFVAEIRETLDRLIAGPGCALATDFHFLRGSAANMGFAAMVDACLTAEAACHAGKTPDIGAIAGCFGASLATVAAVIPGLSHAA